MIRLFKTHRRRVVRALLCLWIGATMLAAVANVRAWADDPKPDPGGYSAGDKSTAINANGDNFVPAGPADGDDAATKKTKQDALDTYTAQAKAEPLAVKLADTVGQNQLGINIAWTLLTGYLVMFMQVGFAMVETGFCRAKNAAHVMMTNIMIYPIGIIGFWICGFAFMFGTVGSGVTSPAALGGLPVLNGHELAVAGFGLLGTKGFFLSKPIYDVSVFAMFLFQMVFMDTAATIPTGAMAERWKFSAFIVYGFFISMICYPFYGHLVWGGGGLATLGKLHNLAHGAVDFAGSGVVHAIGGFTALAGAMVLGPRIGKYNKNGTPNAIPGHHIPMAIVGTLILAFGWFGFNPGSTLGASGGGNLRIAVIAANTMIASASGALAALFMMKKKFGKFDPSMSANGLLAGLVAITAPCAFVNSLGAVLIGAFAGVFCVLAVFFIEKRGVDDPVGAVSVHGVCGIWGVLSVGIFADGTYGEGWNGVPGKVTGLLYGDHKQIIPQIISAVVCMCWAFGASYVFFKLQSKVMRIRPTAEEEMMGMDIPDLGASAYPDFQQLDATSPPVAHMGLVSQQQAPSGAPAVAEA